MKVFYLMALLSVLLTQSRGQAPVEPGFEIMEFYRIADAYLGAEDLSFKFTIDYRDSVYVDSILESTEGVYYISNGRYAMSIDSSIEIRQGDQYNVTVYHLDSLIVVNNKSEMDVLRIPALDSVFRSAYIGNISVTALNDTTRRIYFTFTNDSYPYKDYQLDYDSRTFLAKEIRMRVRQVPDAGSGLSETGIMTIVFMDFYIFPLNSKSFDEGVFVIKTGNTFSVNPFYSGYEILNNTAN